MWSGCVRFALRVIWKRRMRRSRGMLRRLERNVLCLVVINVRSHLLVPPSWSLEGAFTEGLPAVQIMRNV